MKPHALILAVALLSFSSCVNIFSPFDGPSGDPQLLSAARACFNKGDLACAFQDYEKLSSNLADIKNSEEAMTTLEGINAGMGAFVAAFGQGNVSTGQALTSLANSIAGNASRANRVAVFNAHKKAVLVNDTRLRGLSRFVTATALCAEMLAENAAAPGNLLKTDLAIGPASTCQNETQAQILAAGLSDPCAQPSGGRPFQSTGASGASGTLDAIASSAVDTAAGASMEVFNAAVNSINTALTEMNVTSTSANVSGFTGAVVSLAFTAGGGGANAPAYRQGLLQQGIGN